MISSILLGRMVFGVADRDPLKVKFPRRRRAVKCALLLAAILLPFGADAAPQRSQAQKSLFARTHACPATGLFTISCPGYVIDHVIPLCASGADKATNMQWQEYRTSLLKDVQERKQCRALRSR